MKYKIGFDIGGTFNDFVIKFANSFPFIFLTSSTSLITFKMSFEYKIPPFVFRPIMR